MELRNWLRAWFWVGIGFPSDKDFKTGAFMDMKAMSWGKDCPNVRESLFSRFGICVWNEWLDDEANVAVGVSG